MLMNNHGTSELRSAGGIGILVTVCCLGERHQHRRGAANRQLAETAGPSATDDEISMLKQAGNVIAEGAFGQQRMLDAPHLRVIASGEVHNPATPLQKVRKNRANHAIQAHCPLTAPHDHQEWTGSSRNPWGQGLGVQKSLPNGCSGH